MDFTTHLLKIDYYGLVVMVPYWAGGNGRRVGGFCTSLAQLRSKLRRTFGMAVLDLYYCTNRRWRRILCDKHVSNALHLLRHGSTVLIKAFDTNVPLQEWPSSLRIKVLKREGSDLVSFNPRSIRGGRF